MNAKHVLDTPASQTQEPDINKTIKEMMALVRRVMSSNADGECIALSPEARDELICSAVARLTKQAIERHMAAPGAGRDPQGHEDLVKRWEARAQALTDDREVMRDDRVKARMLRECANELKESLCRRMGSGPGSVYQRT